MMNIFLVLGDLQDLETSLNYQQENIGVMLLLEMKNFKKYGCPECQEDIIQTYQEDIREFVDGEPP
jgi:hypothetical protein